jgi:hypothetical protein
VKTVVILCFRRTFEDLAEVRSPDHVWQTEAGVAATLVATSSKAVAMEGLALFIIKDIFQPVKHWRLLKLLAR